MAYSFTVTDAALSIKKATGGKVVYKGIKPSITDADLTTLYTNIGLMFATPPTSAQKLVYNKIA